MLYIEYIRELNYATLQTKKHDALKTHLKVKKVELHENGKSQQMEPIVFLNSIAMQTHNIHGKNV